MQSLFHSTLNNSAFRDSKCTRVLIPTIGLALTGLSTYYLYQTIDKHLRRKRLSKLITERQSRRKENTEKIRLNLHTDNQSIEISRREIVNLNFEELRSRLQNGELTALETLKAFQLRALEAHEKTNCLCEFLLEAEKWAMELDEKYKDPNIKKPPLFGIPISVKETNRLIGHDSTIGFAQYLGHPSDADATLVTVMKELGAVPFVTTNLPQSMLSLGSSNPIYGVTKNPHDPTRSPGGSSSGEGALIALKGSPLGLGTDIGGSVRVPAHNCGICALKPSLGRMTQFGRKGALPGQTGVKATCGPMGYDVDSLVWFMRTVCDTFTFNLDPYVIPCPFNEDLYSSDGPSLTIGYYDYDNWLEPTVSCKRAVQVARRILESKGHKLIKITFPFDKAEMRKFLETYVAALIPDGGHVLNSQFSNDISDPYHSTIISMFSTPNWIRRLKAYCSKSKRWATVLRAFASNTAEQTRALSNIDIYKYKFVQFWQEYKLDALISPALATVPLPVSIPPSLFAVLWSYSAIYNLLDFPAGIVPCTLVTKKDEEDTLKSDKSDNGDEDWISELLRKHARGTVGLAVGVQCIALPYREEICLRLMKEIEISIKENSE